MNDWGNALTGMRTTAPLVHNITNYVSMNIMANVLIAAGASPAMVHAEEEAAEFAGIASALVVNIGTLSTPWIASMKAAASVAADRPIPWVLDPVAVGATGLRRDAGEALIGLKPAIVKGNASEIMALAGAAAGGKGVDSAHAVEAAEASARALAETTGGVVAVTGAVDYVTDGTTAYRIENGHPAMAQITALGCSLGGVIGAFAAANPALEGTVAALAYFGLAGERAAQVSTAPGSFAVAFLDALAGIDAAALTDGAKVSPA